MKTQNGNDEEYAEEQLIAAFATFGDEVKREDVPALVRAGRDVWSFGYGDDEDEFTTITEEDLWAWEGIPHVNTEPAPDVVASWAPFRVSPLASEQWRR